MITSRVQTYLRTTAAAAATVNCFPCCVVYVYPISCFDFFSGKLIFAVWVTRVGNECISASSIWGLRLVSETGF